MLERSTIGAGGEEKGQAPIPCADSRNRSQTLPRIYTAASRHVCCPHCHSKALAAAPGNPAAFACKACLLLFDPNLGIPPATPGERRAVCPRCGEAELAPGHPGVLGVLAEDPRWAWRFCGKWRTRYLVRISICQPPRLAKGNSAEVQMPLFATAGGWG